MFTLYHIKKRRHIPHGSSVPKLPKGTWLNVEAPTEDELKLLSKKAGIKLHELRHAIDDKEHPRVFPLENFTQIVFRVPFVGRNDATIATSCAFFVNKDMIISIHKEPYKKLQEISKLLAEGHVDVSTPGELLCYIFDEIMRQYFRIADILEDHLDELEDMIFSDPTDIAVVQEIFSIKKTLIYLYKSLTANREVVLGLEKGYGNGLNKKDLNHMRYVYHDITQLIDMIETLREIITSTLEIHVSGISNRLNVAMKKLTVYGSIVLIPTLIASIYGMNFKYMPELNWKYGYIFSLVLMAVSAICIYLYFKKSEWI
jgi:magnesium transporter